MSWQSTCDFCSHCVLRPSATKLSLPLDAGKDNPSHYLSLLRWGKPCVWCGAGLSVLREMRNNGNRDGNLPKWLLERLVSQDLYGACLNACFFCGADNQACTIHLSKLALLKYPQWMIFMI